MQASTMHHATIHNLYQYAVNGGYKSNHDNDISLSIMSAHMAMNNIMPYHVDIARDIQLVSNIVASQWFANKIITLLEITSDLNIKFPTPQKLGHELMRGLWSTVFQSKWYWPEFCCSPFGLGHPLSVMNANKKVEATGTKIGTFYGTTQLDIWQEVWTFPIPVIAQNVLQENNKFEKASEIQSHMRYARLSFRESYYLDTQFMEFFDTMTFLMQELRGYVWLPIVWPEPITVNIELEEAPEPITYPDQVSTGHMIRMLGIFEYVDQMVRSMENLLDRMKSDKNSMSSEDKKDEESVKAYMYNRLLIHLGVDSFKEDGTENKIDDPDRYSFVNSGIKVLRATFKAYMINQTG